MKTTKFWGIPFVLFFYMLMTLPFQACDPDEGEDECDTCMMVYKPNIYLYPTEAMDVAVSLSFPMGGQVVTSIPEYGNGWQVHVDTNGLIDNSYTYLFYESTQPDVWQKQQGWVIEQGLLEEFFEEKMAAYGFNAQEIADFVNYWIPRLDNDNYYAIYPQTQSIIEEVIQLQLSEEPGQLLRLFFVIEGEYDQQDTPAEPRIDSFLREGYVVTEWGVVLN